MDFSDRPLRGPPGPETTIAGHSFIAPFRVAAEVRAGVRVRINGRVMARVKVRARLSVRDRARLALVLGRELPQLGVCFDKVADDKLFLNQFEAARHDETNFGAIEGCLRTLIKVVNGGF